MFSHQLHPIFGTVVFLGSLVGMIWLFVLLNKARYKGRKPSFSLTLMAIIGIMIIATFGGVQPLANYKDQLIVSIQSSIPAAPSPTSTPKSPPPTPEMPQPKEPAHVAPTPTTPEPVIVPKASLPEIKPVQLAPIESGLLELINRERANNGAHKLAWNGHLYDLAKEHSRYMSESGVFTYSEHTQYYENIYKGNAYVDGPVSWVMSTWMGSTEHRNILLRAQITKCGIGMIKSGTTMYVTWIAE